MKWPIRFAMVTSVLLLATSSYGQSLAETAKKEKERREKNQTEGKTATEVDEYALRNAKGDRLSVVGKDPSGTSRWRRSSSARRSSPAAASRGGRSGSNSATASTSPKDTRDQCRVDLKKAEKAMERQQALLDRGVAQVATIDTTKGPHPPRPSKDVYYPIVVARTGPQTGGQGGAKVDVEGTLIPCNQALGNSSKYPNEAKKCAEIKKKIAKADAKKQKALRCLQSR